MALWPAGAEAVLLWTEALLLWAAASYFVGRDPAVGGAAPLLGAEQQRRWTTRVAARSGAAALFAALLAGPGAGGRLALGATVLALCLVLPLGRAEVSRRRPALLAEWELGVALVAVVGLALLVARLGLVASHAPPAAPLSTARLAALCALGAGLAFALRGGTHIVRGVLDKTGALPPRLSANGASVGEHRSRDEAALAAGAPSLQHTGVFTTTPAPRLEAEVDVPEYNRGRLIGEIERLLLVVIVLVGSYPAMGFLIAAKGLIRVKEFEHRGFAEYFLIGTLTSTTLALVVGLLLQVTLRALW